MSSGSTRTDIGEVAQAAFQHYSKRYMTEIAVCFYGRELVRVRRYVSNLASDSIASGHSSARLVEQNDTLSPHERHVERNSDVAIIKFSTHLVDSPSFHNRLRSTTYLSTADTFSACSTHERADPNGSSSTSR